MRFKIHFFILGLMGLTSFVSQAMPEALLGSHNETIQELIKEKNGDLSAIRSVLVMPGLPALDQLWLSREDFVQGACNQVENDCRVLSIFRGSTTDQPVVILPGFTGWRQSFIEEVFDLLQNGYGPIYVSDFSGTGDSFKPELKPGEPEPLIPEFLQKRLPPQYASSFEQEIQNIVPLSDQQQVTGVLQQLPLGLGHIHSFDTYFADIDFIMNKAVSDNPQTPVLLTSLSMSGLSLMRILAEQDQHPTWIRHVSRIVLESPMIRVQATDTVFKTGGFAIEFLAEMADILYGTTSLPSPAGAVPQFVDKALGHFNPNNIISHSANRTTFTDGLRTWNGHETAGATDRWGYEEMSHQYSKGPLDMLPFTDPLNNRVAAIAHVLSQFQVPLITLTSKGDTLIDPEATQMFLKDLSDSGLQNSTLCLFQTAKHQIDIETDTYREPFLDLLFDQKWGRVQASYGQAPRNELLKCASVTSH